ncbi:MAG: hypothetical protein HC787_01835 [Nostocaceae cyanobacterium CSU_2_110]|nr:hypothetical protein [Nostocaceae cyanobacterium CSU_2_110]
MGIAASQAKMLEQETRQREELTRSNEELQQFAFIASHDLQEPLRKIIAFGDRLKATCENALTDKGYDYLQRMENAAQRMQALIEDLLTLSRLTTKAQPFVQVNLAQVTHEVLSDLEIVIAQTKARIEIGRPARDRQDRHRRHPHRGLAPRSVAGKFSRRRRHSRRRRGSLARRRRR